MGIIGILYRKEYYYGRAEKEYFGEFAPQRDLFEKYGIWCWQIMVLVIKLVYNKGTV